MGLSATSHGGAAIRECRIALEAALGGPMLETGLSSFAG